MAKFMIEMSNSALITEMDYLFVCLFRPYKRQNNQENVANLLRLENSKRKVEYEKLELFRKRAASVEIKCKGRDIEIIHEYSKSQNKPQPINL